ncbi:hypothetical protein [Lysobacter tyrosinilyticus]
MCDTRKVPVLGAGGGLALGAFATLSARGRKDGLVRVHDSPALASLEYASEASMRAVAGHTIDCTQSPNSLSTVISASGHGVGRSAIDKENVMTVGESTAFEDARRALRCAIWRRHGRRVEGSAWISSTPGGDPPGDLGCNKQAWTKTLRIAASTLRSWEYTLPEVSLDDAESVLDENFNRSVRLLFEAMTAYRPTGVAIACDDGGGA